MQILTQLDSADLTIGQTVLVEYSSTNRPVICTVQSIAPVIFSPVKPIWNPYAQVWNDSPIVYRHYQHKLYALPTNHPNLRPVV